MYLKLREDVFVRFHEQNIEFIGQKVFKIKDVGKKLKTFIENLELGLKKSEFSSLEKKLLDLLWDKNLLIEVDNFDNRNQNWEAHFQLRNPLREKAVLIIGCGGTGAIIADHLARCGLARLGLVDGAVLDPPDLNRQFTYHSKDIGKDKVTLLKDHIESQTQAKVGENHIIWFNTQNIAKITDQYDLIINCADKPQFEIQKSVIQLGKKINTPVLFGSVVINDYVVGPLLKTSSEMEKLHKKIGLQQEKLSRPSKIITGSNALLNTRAAIDIAIKAYEFLANRDLVFSVIDGEELM